MNDAIAASSTKVKATGSLIAGVAVRTFTASSSCVVERGKGAASTQCGYLTQYRQTDRRGGQRDWDGGHGA